jgi:hypothetical protein
MKHTVSPFLLPDLFFGGCAILTFKNEDKGTHMTVKVSQMRNKLDRKIKLPIFNVKISLLNDGEQGMVYAGTIFKETGSYRVANGINPEGRIAKALAFLNAAVKNTDLLNEKNVSFQHMGKCCSCGMTLTHPASIPTGFGPACLVHKFNDPNFKMIFDMTFPDYEYK